MNHPDDKINQALINLLDAIIENNREPGYPPSVLFFYHGDYILKAVEGKPLPYDCTFSDNDILVSEFGG